MQARLTKMSYIGLAAIAMTAAFVLYQAQNATTTGKPSPMIIASQAIHAPPKMPRMAGQANNVFAKGRKPCNLAASMVGAAPVMRSSTHLILSSTENPRCGPYSFFALLRPEDDTRLPSIAQYGVHLKI